MLQNTPSSSRTGIPARMVRKEPRDTQVLRHPGSTSLAAAAAAVGSSSLEKVRTSRTRCGTGSGTYSISLALEEVGSWWEQGRSKTAVEVRWSNRLHRNSGCWMFRNCWIGSTRSSRVSHQDRDYWAPVRKCKRRQGPCPPSLRSCWLVSGRRGEPTSCPRS